MSRARVRAPAPLQSMELHLNQWDMACHGDFAAVPADGPCRRLGVGSGDLRPAVPQQPARSSKAGRPTGPTEAINAHQSENPHDAYVFVGDGRKALFLRNHGDEKFLFPKTEQVFVDADNPASHEQGTDRPGRNVAGMGTSRRSASETTDWLLARADIKPRNNAAAFSDRNSFLALALLQSCPSVVSIGPNHDCSIELETFRRSKLWR